MTILIENANKVNPLKCHKATLSTTIWTLCNEICLYCYCFRHFQKN